jgi:hypothetical protein
MASPTRPSTAVLAALLAFGAAPSARAATFLGPTPYLDVSNSPLDTTALDFRIEDFEDGLLNVPGIVASAGTPVAPGDFTDSVDGDDGSIDGLGRAGHAFSAAGEAITFTFDPLLLGGLPTEAGIVWTDGSGEVTFEAFDADGLPLGAVGPLPLGDGAADGATPEDRFFGVAGAAISAIRIVSAGGGLEVDHVQLGSVNRPPDCSGAYAVPSTLWPPNHRMATIDVLGIVDPDGDPVFQTVADVGQDEPVDDVGDGSTCPDALGVGTDTAQVRVERSGPGDGRVYAITVLAEDGRDGACTAVVTVCVPHDRGHGDACGDQGPFADSAGLACIDACHDYDDACTPPPCHDEPLPRGILRRLARAGHLLDRAARGHHRAARRAARLLAVVERKLAKLAERGRIDAECVAALGARVQGAAGRAAGAP